MQDWILEEAALLQQEQEAFGIVDRIPYFKAPQGETKIEIDITHAPFVGKFEGKKVFHIFVEGTQYLWTVSMKSPLYRDVITSLKNDKKIFKLIRIGLDVKSTRYQLVPL
jgi:hypothetical protein